jgi:hypothetical protein
MRRRAGNPRELKQVVMTLHFPPQPPQLLPTSCPYLTLNSAKNEAATLLKTRGRKNAPAKNEAARLLKIKRVTKNHRDSI